MSCTKQNYIKALKQKAEAKALEAALEETYLKKFQQEQKIRNAEIGLEVYNIQRRRLEKQKEAADELGMGGATQVLIEKKNKQISDQQQFITDLNREQSGLNATIDNYTKRIEQNSVAVEFNTGKLTGLLNTSKEIKGVWDDISVPNYDYGLSQMTPKGLPAADNLLGGGGSGDTVPEFDYTFTDFLQQQNEQLFNATVMAGLYSNALGGLADAFVNLAETGEGSMKSLVMSTLGGIRQIITAKLAEAMAGQAAANSKFGLPGLALAALGISGVMALFAKLPKFAAGGIVPGNLLSGDMVTARVNSGEMILNQSQQARLFNIANRGGIVGGDVRFILEGDKLIGAIDNRNKRIRSGY